MFSLLVFKPHLALFTWTKSWELFVTEFWSNGVTKRGSFLSIFAISVTSHWNVTRFLKISVKHSGENWFALFSLWWMCPHWTFLVAHWRCCQYQKKEQGKWRTFNLNSMFFGGERNYQNSCSITARYNVSVFISTAATHLVNAAGLLSGPNHLLV